MQTESGTSPTPEPLTAEVLAEQEQTLRDGIERGVEWFEFAQVEENYFAMSEKEQTFSRLLDPLIWSMREALITYEHEDCDDCKTRREANGNQYGVAVAMMLLGRDVA